MKNPLIAYSLARLGVFAAVLALFLLLQFPWLWATLFAAMLSFAFSLVFLRKQREASSEMIYNAVHKPKKTKDEEVED